MSDILSLIAMHIHNNTIRLLLIIFSFAKCLNWDSAEKNDLPMRPNSKRSCLYLILIFPHRYYNLVIWEMRETKKSYRHKIIRKPIYSLIALEVTKGKHRISVIEGISCLLGITSLSLSLTSYVSHWSQLRGIQKVIGHFNTGVTCQLGMLSKI